MPDTHIDEIIESLRSIESSMAGRDALAAPRRGDYMWSDDEADDPPVATPVVTPTQPPSPVAER